MIKYTETEITFKEVPKKVCRCFSVSNCGMHCKNCHSPELQGDNGEKLTIENLLKFIEMDKRVVDCYVFLGEGKDRDYLKTILKICKGNGLETCIYSGRDEFDLTGFVGILDYLKLGPYVEELGGLDNPNTNQRFYEIDPISGNMTDKTEEFYVQKK